MPDVAQLLQTLHPMREPPMPAPIMPYLAALSVGVACAVAGFVALRFAGRYGRGMRRAAQATLAASRRLRAADRLAAQAQLLRDLARIQLGEADARLHGTAWLAALDRLFVTTFFTRGEGAAFGDALYRPGADHSVEALDTALQRMIAKSRFKANAAERRA